MYQSTIQLVDVLEPETVRATRRERLISALDWMAMLTAVITVSALPWILGSAIPLARIILSAGSAVASLSSVAASVLDRRRSSFLPLPALLGVGMAGVGILQLLPLYAPAVSEMRHAVFAELGPSAANSTMLDSGRWGVPRTLSPSDTRLGVSQWLSLSLLFLVSFETLRSVFRLRICLSLLTANASMLATAGLLQRLDKGQMIIGEHWKLNAVDGFGAFVNPNNAAGGLCIHLAAAISLLYLEWKSALPVSQQDSAGGRRLSGLNLLREKIRDIMSGSQQVLAALSIRQIIVLGAVLLVLAGIAAALSRSGLIAAGSGLIVCFFWRMRRGRWVWLLISVVAIAAVFLAFLGLLGLDQPIVAELTTLQDPVSEIRVRLHHWRDSLQLVRDFPMIGAGMNSYRFSTLPYQTSSIGKWFCNADNQFVEVLVECGLTGALLCVGLGGLSLCLLIRLERASGLARGSDSLQMSALVLILLLIAVTQTVSAMFDYGIGLPGNSAAIAVLWGAAMAPFSGVGLSGRKRRFAPSPRLVRWRTPGWVSGLIRIVLIAATVSFLPEQLAAHRIHEQVVAADRLLKDPHGRPSPAALSAVRSLLSDRLVARPDDPAGLVALTRLQEALYRHALIRSASGEAELTVADFRRLWDILTPEGLADLVLQARIAKSTIDAVAVSQAATELLAEYPWVSDAETALRHVPLWPGLSTDVLACRLLTDPDSVTDHHLLEILFREPAGARRLFQTGHFCLLTGRRQPAIRLWQQSLNAAEQFRRAILDDALNFFPATEAVDLFGPNDYINTVLAADGSKDPELGELLWRRADQLWSAAAGNSQTRPISLQRARHLRHRQGIAAAVDWLAERLVEYPDDLDLRMFRARLLEQQGNPREALNEWIRLDYFFPDHMTVQKNIERLNRLSVPVKTD